MFQKHKTILETVLRCPFSMLSKCQVDVKNVTKYCRLPPKKTTKKVNFEKKLSYHTWMSKSAVKSSNFVPLMILCWNYIARIAIIIKFYKISLIFVTFFWIWVCNPCPKIQLSDVDILLCSQAWKKEKKCIWWVRLKTNISNIVS